MIELARNALAFSFPDLHPDATLRVAFRRTLRVPDEPGFPQPPRRGAFALRRAAELAERLPERWREHGGLLLPIHRSEALWIELESPQGYPFALDLAAGRIEALVERPAAATPPLGARGLLTVPAAPWRAAPHGAARLRQYLALPPRASAAGPTATPAIRLTVYPLRSCLYPERGPGDGAAAMGPCCGAVPLPDLSLSPSDERREAPCEEGGALLDWDLERAGHCLVQLVPPRLWLALTGEAPPGRPPGERDYAEAGLPWSDAYAEAPLARGPGPGERAA